MTALSNLNEVRRISGIMGSISSTTSTTNSTAIPALRSSKRKRNQVSYFDGDHFPELDIGIETVEEDDADDDFGSTLRTRGAKAKARAAKKAKRMPRPKPQKPFRFLDLPAELRDEIYELALVEPTGLTLNSRTKHHRRIVARGDAPVARWDYYGYRNRYRPAGHIQSGDGPTPELKHRSLIPNILAVNKQIHAEGSAYLYKQDIILEDTHALFTFVTGIGQYNRGLLRTITVRGWGLGRGIHKAHNYAAFSILSTCPNLRRILFDCSFGYYRNPRRLAAQIYRDGHYFLEAFGAANGGADAVVNVLQFGAWHFDKHATGYYDGEGEPDFDQSKRDEFEDELRKWLKKGSKRLS